MKHHRSLMLFKLFCTLAVALMLALVLVLIGFLLQKGLSTLNLELFFGKVAPWDAITGRRPVWQGIWPALLGTFSLVCLTMALAFLPGIGCGIFLAEYATPWQRRVGSSIVDMMAGIPSIVMGLFGFLLILLLRRTFWPQANTSLLLAAACLALLVLPVIIVTTREAFEAIPANIRLTATTLGICKFQCVWHILLPSASRGLFGGLVLAIGRVAEDTAVIMLTGVVANSGMPAGLTHKFEALPFTIYVTAAEYQSAQELARGFSTSLVLLFLSAFILLCAGMIEKSYKRFWAGGSR